MSVVGVDLGTTHTAVARGGGVAGEPAALFRIAQLVSSTETVCKDLLASCLYAPLPHERYADPWGDAPWIVGDLARRRGAEVSSRFVASAKSWLAYGAVDRCAPILPWGVDAPDAVRISPLDASAKYLAHVRRAYDAAYPREPLADQTVVLTVPASFDEGARELTLEAARLAGIRVSLLEEPQAAFYEYLSRTGDAGLEHMLAGQNEVLVLICDVGGGTTDLSLVRVRRQSGPDPVSVERVAVGSHLLLGGDNMDLAIAHLCERRMLPHPDRLDPVRFSELVLAARAAKERLLGADAPDGVEVVIAGGGSRIVGATRSARVSREEVRSIVVDGFFPMVAEKARPERKRGGLVTFGLPYEPDVAITRHVAVFIARHAEGLDLPRSVLLNGGMFHAAAVRERLREVLESWVHAPVTVLANPNPDLAVALGAVAYGLARQGHGRRIQSGTARGYYLGIESHQPRTCQLLCVVPRGTPEGEVQIVRDRPLALVVGRPARFQLFASDDAPAHEPGTIVPFDEDHFAELPPLVTAFEANGTATNEVRVALEGELSPVGTLEMSCVEFGDSGEERRRFRLAFELRGGTKDGKTERASESTRPAASITAKQVDEARGLIARAFAKRASEEGREAKDLVRELEKLLGDRPTWTASLSRALFDELVLGMKSRRRSPEHERAFWMIAGYTLRPGFGAPGDATRIGKVAPLFAERIFFPESTRNWQQFWVAWRRIAAGLDQVVQTSIRDELDPLFLSGPARKKPKGWKREAVSELIELVSCLERVEATRRAEMGEALLERTYVDRDARLRAAIGRIGARTPTYASLHYVVAPRTAESWLEQLLREDWRDNPATMQAAVSLARRTGDRARDVSDAMRQSVERKLTRERARPEWIRAVVETVPLEAADREAFFGEGLPVGLRLVET